MTLSFPLWLIPTIITIICYGYVIFIYDNNKYDSGYLRGINVLLMLIPASIISLISWIIYAIFK